MAKITGFQKKLRKSAGQLVEIRRHIKGTKSTCGFLVDFTPEIILFQSLDWDTFRLNGYSAVLDADIKDFRVFDRSTYWQHRAVKHYQLEPTPLPTVSIASLSALLSTVAARFPLVTIHRERIDPNVCYIGQLAKLSRATFTLEDLNYHTEWTGPRRIRFNDVTRLDFGGGYESALAATAPKRK
ncbi:MAG TPA: hypothetical protein VGH19_02030 [Verrucomicrobiae bacterium]